MLSNYRGTKVRKQDVTIAKNYMNEKELAVLNNLVEQYLIFARGQTMRHVPIGSPQKYLHQAVNIRPYPEAPIDVTQNR